MDCTVLIEAGVDVSGAIERFVGNEQLFARMLKKHSRAGCDGYHNLRV